MTRLDVTIKAPTWMEAAEGGADRARRSRLAGLLRDMATAVEQGRAEAVFERPGLVGTFKLELPARSPADEAA